MNADNTSTIEGVSKEVNALMKGFPLYADLK
jgi:hypothetical protein